MPKLANALSMAQHVKAVFLCLWESKKVMIFWGESKKSNSAPLVSFQRIQNMHFWVFVLNDGQIVDGESISIHWDGQGVLCEIGA